MTALLPLALVVAVADDGTIGKGGTLPWHLPEDLRHFRRLTLGHAVIMGRRTHASIGRALPQRTNIVVTRDPAYAAPGCAVARNLPEALSLARSTDAEPRVIGGASLYAEALPLTTRMYMTLVHERPSGDVFFPPFDQGAFREVARGEGETPGVEFVTLERREGAGA